MWNPLEVVQSALPRIVLNNSTGMIVSDAQRELKSNESIQFRNCDQMLIDNGINKQQALAAPSSVIRNDGTCSKDRGHSSSMARSSGRKARKSIQKEKSSGSSHHPHALNALNLKTIEELIQLKQLNRSEHGSESENTRQKRLNQYKPSSFCHICTRSSSDTLPVLVCAELVSGKCRKVICKKCFDSFQWDWNEAVSQNERWMCIHCVGECPSLAQCHAYHRTNERRKKMRANDRRNRRNAMSP
eukprot:CAMPEP_0182442308 /NCGR_PEP_ID=MMETSP1172-20130603/1228_1 /TAXON_ID=708627 /ORGANISM="Timspurckia oligopyrenoides, Strain CCMP3278" /LENGTH=243 /DNA_ID=CAMNT_0024637083 /DNA_START=145 /DNA_END=876 /DNA_ORIENTATION=+